MKIFTKKFKMSMSIVVLAILVFASNCGCPILEGK